MSHTEDTLDQEDMLLTLDQLSQTLEVMEQVVNRLKQQMPLPQASAPRPVSVVIEPSNTVH